MKFYLLLDDEKEPSVTVVCGKVTDTVRKIEELCKDFEAERELLYVYDEEEILPLDLSSVACFFTKEGKVFASIGNREYATKLRIKHVLEMVDDSFIKINQGCIANVGQIQKFSVSFGGAFASCL